MAPFHRVLSSFSLNDLPWLSTEVSLAMFDRLLFPSVDSLLADLESVAHTRSNVMVDRLPPGTWGQGVVPSDTNPVVLIVVAEQAREFQHAIASWHAYELLRKYEHDAGLVATLNPEHLHSVERETAERFADKAPAEKIPGLARILYDGIARQIRSAINGLVIHRRMRSSQPDLALQHRNWTEALIRQNRGFWQQAVSIGDQYPERLVRWNRILMVLEVVGLGRIADVPIPPDIGASAEAKTVRPLVESIMAGDVDALSDRDLTGLACRMASIPEDWVSWAPAEKAWRGPSAPAGSRDTVGDAVSAGKSQKADEGEYGRQLAEADRLRVAGDLRAAAKIYGRLLDQGGNADQRVLMGRALALDQEKPSEAIKLAKLTIELDPSTPLADAASALITKHTGERVHRDIPIRPDVIAYLTEARDFFARDETAGKKAWMEVGMLAGGGVTDDGQARYRIAAVDGGRMMTGLAVMAWIYAGTKTWAPQHADKLPDFSKEWNLVIGRSV